MRFLLDACVGRAVEERLRALGHDVASVLDGPPRVPDRHILERGHEEDRIVVTMDLDFGEIAVRQRARHRGIIILRMEEARVWERAEAIEMIVSEAGERLKEALSVFHAGRLRITRARTGQ
jgi:predicted nuclease of predicted toxin-antitoxin system